MPYALCIEKNNDKKKLKKKIYLPTFNFFEYGTPNIYIYIYIYLTRYVGFASSMMIAKLSQIFAKLPDALTKSL